jgi:hypothetical protein
MIKENQIILMLKENQIILMLKENQIILNKKFMENILNNFLFFFIIGYDSSEYGGSSCLFDINGRGSCAE